MKKVFRIILVVGVVMVMAAAAMLFYLTRGLDEGAALEIGEINPAAFADGSYNGSYDFRRWGNELEVVIEGGKITEIKVLEGMMTVDDDVEEKLFSQVFERQSLDVDIVSGATVSSKAYLKSIENALSKNG